MTGGTQGVWRKTRDPLDCKSDKGCHCISLFTSGPVPVGAAAAARRALPLAGEHAQVGLSVAGIARPTIGVGVCACVCMGSVFFFKGRALSVGIYETIVFVS